MGVQRHTVAHFKALINAKVDLEAQGRGGTITICHAQSKKAVLHRKTAIVRIFFRLTVPKVSLGRFFQFFEALKKSLMNLTLGLFRVKWGCVVG